MLATKTLVIWDKIIPNNKPIINEIRPIKNVSINNKKYPIIGDVCMDMTLVKVDPTIRIHDKVEIFGSSISIKSVSSLLGTNAYHILTGITTRVPRVYSDNKEIKY